jgi:signal transduction histidine kinase/CheY-like chemotaxis protein
VSLRKKLLLIVAGIGVIIAVLNYAILALLVQPEFNRIERKNAQDDAKRVILAIDNEIHNLDIWACDWSGWDDTYEFVQNRSEEYISSNLVTDTFSDMHINAIYFFDTSGKLVWGKAYDLEGDELKEISLEEFPPNGLPKDHVLLKHTSTKRVVRGGLFQTERGPMLISAQPILTSLGKGPSRGTFIAGRFLNKKMQKSLSDQTRVPFCLCPVKGNPDPLERRAAEELTRTKQESYIHVVSDDIISVIRLLQNVEGRPQWVIQSQSPRTISAQGRRVFRTSVLSIGLAVAVIAVVTVILVGRFILIPIVRMTEHAIRLGKGQTRQPFIVCGNDEIAILARESNRLLEEIDKRQEGVRQAAKLEAVGQLAGGVAHDFRNRLTVILGFSELMLMKMAPNDPDRKPLEEIIAAAQRANELTRQLLTFSRRQPLHPQPTQLNSLLVRLTDSFGRVLSEGIELEVHPGDNLPPILVDPSAMEEAILNLVINARDAMPQGGRLTLCTETFVQPSDRLSRFPNAAPGQYALLTVQDTGGGMDAETRRHIFEPFYTTKGPGKGAGLGLAMVYGLVKQSGGFIFMNTEHGQGTYFSLLFPACQQEQGEEETPAQPKDLPTGRETILFLEDDESVRDVIRRLLTSLGYRVWTPKSAEEARGLFRSKKVVFDLLITDVIMPDVKGPVLAEEMRGIRPNIPVLFLTAYAEDISLQDGSFKGLTHVLVKPVEPARLAQKVRVLLDTSVPLLRETGSASPE